MTSSTLGFRDITARFATGRTRWRRMQPHVVRGMNIDELWPLIVAAWQDHSVVLRRTAMPAHQPSDKTVLEPAADDSGRWVVYYSERGQIWDPVYFDTENAACAFVYARATEPEPVAHTTTPEQDRRTAELNVEGQKRRRQILIDAGYDPDTLRKL